MIGMYDASCTCGKRFGWQGTLADKPPCPKCGKYDKPSRSDIDQIETLERLMEQNENDFHQLIAQRRNVFSEILGSIGKDELPKHAHQNLFKASG